jgi:hypothetical protein
MENLNDTTNDTTTGTAEGALVDKNGNPTPFQVEKWRQAHGKVKCFEVDGKDVYFKQPDRKLVSAASAALAKTRDVTTYQETILKNTQLNFKEETAADDELYFSLSNKVDEIITSKTATLKN